MQHWRCAQKNDLKSNGFGIGRKTVYEYLTYIEDAYLAFTIPLYSEAVRKTQVNPRKIYASAIKLIFLLVVLMVKNI
jgi:predicted AAA+ superfamily ATPase